MVHVGQHNHVVPESTNGTVPHHVADIYNLDLASLIAIHLLPVQAGRAIQPEFLKRSTNTNLRLT